MKLILFATCLSALATAASIAQRSETVDSKLPVVDISKIENFADKPTDGQKVNFNNKAIANPDARWCSYGFWCDDNSPSCCPAACCLPGTNVCGSDGHCYIQT